MKKHTPAAIKLRQKSRQMEISFTDGKRFEQSYEFLRVDSPSAEVRSHRPRATPAAAPKSGCH